MKKSFEIHLLRDSSRKPQHTPKSGYMQCTTETSAYIVAKAQNKTKPKHSLGVNINPGYKYELLITLICSK